MSQREGPEPRSIWARITQRVRAFFNWIASFLPDGFKKRSPDAPQSQEVSQQKLEQDHEARSLTSLTPSLTPVVSSPPTPSARAEVRPQDRGALSIKPARNQASLSQQDLTQIGNLYTGFFFDKFSVEEFAALPEIRGINIKMRNGIWPLLRPLTQADLQGYSAIRGVDSHGVPFIGFTAFDPEKVQQTIYTIFGHETAGYMAWKVCEREASNTQDNIRLEYDNLRYKNSIDSDRLSLLVPKIPQASPVAPPRSRNFDLAEVNRLYPAEYLSTLGVNNIAALPVANLNRPIRRHDADDYFPEFRTPKPKEFGRNKVIRGIDTKGEPFISYESSIGIRTAIHTIFRNDGVWYIIKDTEPYDNHPVTYHGPDSRLASVSKEDFDALSRLLNSPTPRLQGVQREPQLSPPRPSIPSELSGPPPYQGPDNPAPPSYEDAVKPSLQALEASPPPFAAPAAPIIQNPIPPASAAPSVPVVPVAAAPDAQEIEKIREEYSGSLLLTKFTPEQIALLPKIKAFVRESGGMSRLYRPLTQADLNGNSAVRGIDRFGPFIGFVPPGRPNTIVTLYYDQSIGYKVERQASETSDGKRVSYENVTLITDSDLNLLAAVMQPVDRLPRP